MTGTTAFHMMHTQFEFIQFLCVTFINSQPNPDFSCCRVTYAKCWVIASLLLGCFFCNNLWFNNFRFKISSGSYIIFSLLIFQLIVYACIYCAHWNIPPLFPVKIHSNVLRRYEYLLLKGVCCALHIWHGKFNLWLKWFFSVSCDIG